MTFVQGRLLKVLLHYVLIFRPFHSPLHNTVDLVLCLWVGVLHRCVDALLDSDVLCQSLTVPLVSPIQLKTHLFNFGGDEYSSALRAGLGLANVEDTWILLRLSLRHFSIIN